MISKNLPGEIQSEDDLGRCVNKKSTPSDTGFLKIGRRDRGVKGVRNVRDLTAEGVLGTI